MSRRSQAKPMVMAAEPMVMAAAQRFLDLYCPRLASSCVFKTKEDVRPCLLQTGAKVSLDLKTAFQYIGPSFRAGVSSAGPCYQPPACTRLAFCKSNKQSRLNFLGRISSAAILRFLPSRLFLDRGRVFNTVTAL